jgi:two-component sensor histidine kinase
VSEASDLEAPAPARPAGAPADFGAVFAAAPSPLLVIAADPPRYTMVAVNRAHAAAFRTTPEALTGRGVFEVFPDPPDAVAQAFMETIRATLERVLASRRASQTPVQPYAVPGRRGQAEERYWTATLTPIFDEAGAVTHLLSMARDVTAEVKERHATEARALLMREVDHRARNALTVVQSIVRLTTARGLDGFKQVVLGRVEALARAQTSLARRKWEGAFLHEVIEAELAAMAEPSAWRLEGAPTLLAPEKVQAMSMIVHELATNAAKYGALSAPSGVVSVAWTAGPDGLRLRWRETGGPPAAAPGRTGFGSRLMGQLARQLGGGLRYDWRPDGLTAELTAPL